MDKPFFSATIGNLHVGRAWNNHEIEDACPCHKAPCGLVDEPSDECDQHSPTACKTMRQGHSAGMCGRA